MCLSSPAVQVTIRDSSGGLVPTGAVAASPLGDLSAVMVVTEAMKVSAGTWAIDRAAGGGDPRIQRLVEDSPDVSDDVSKLITEVWPAG